MWDSISLKTLILAESVLVLAIICILLFLYAYKQRQLRHHILNEYRKLRQRMTEAGLLQTGPHQETIPPPTPTRDVKEHLRHIDEVSRERFTKLTQATIPRLSPELPFAAKVAALRHLYAEAEVEAYDHPAGTHRQWIVIERKLAEIVRWIGQETQSRKPQRNQRLRLLQERVDALKPFEVENARLLKQLATAKSRQKKLEQYQQDSRRTIQNLEKLIRTLGKNDGKPKETPAQHKEKFRHYSYQDHLRDALTAHDKSADQLGTIAEISGQKTSLLQRISQDLISLPSDVTEAQRKRLEETIKSLELDLQKSDYHITNLQKELRNTKESLHQQPLVILNPALPHDQNNHTEAPQSPVQVPGTGEDFLKIVHSNIENRNTGSTSNQLKHSDDRQRTLAEIQQLRLNNQNQRGVIIDLEKELRILRREVQNSDDEAVNAERGKDIAKLEKLVKECEHCIETLESEVDLLHLQLQESESKKNNPENPLLDPDIAELNLELETVSSQLQKTIKHYQKANILNRFSSEILDQTSVENIARLLIQAIKDLNVIAGFFIHSIQGQAEYYAGEHFNVQEKARMKGSPAVSRVSYLNEGMFFSNNHINLLVKSPPDDDEEQIILETTISGLIAAAGKKLQHMETEQKLHRKETRIRDWLSQTKEHLNKLDIQYAYQTEESRRVVESLIKELRKATEMVDMSGSAHVVFDNAISECKNQIGRLFEGGRAIDEDFSQLFEDLEKLSKESEG